MKTMKAFCTAFVLILTLSFSAFAGEIATPGAAQNGNPSTGTFLTSPAIQPTATEVTGLYASTINDVLLTLALIY